MRLSLLTKYLLLILLVGTFGCYRPKQITVGTVKAASSTSIVEQIGTDPFEIGQLSSDAIDLLAQGQSKEADKKLKLIKRYSKSAPGFCAIKDTGIGTQYLVTISPKDRDFTAEDFNQETFTIVAANNFETAWKKILELKKIGLCKNVGLCPYEVRPSDRTIILQIPIYGSNARIFYDRAGFDQYMSMAKGVGLCK